MHDKYFNLCLQKIKLCVVHSNYMVKVHVLQQNVFCFCLSFLYSDVMSYFMSTTGICCVYCACIIQFIWLNYGFNTINLKWCIVQLSQICMINNEWADTIKKDASTAVKLLSDACEISIILFGVMINVKYTLLHRKDTLRNYEICFEQFRVVPFSSSKTITFQLYKTVHEYSIFWYSIYYLTELYCYEYLIVRLPDYQIIHSKFLSIFIRSNSYFI